MFKELFCETSVQFSSVHDCEIRIHPVSQKLPHNCLCLYIGTKTQEGICCKEKGEKKGGQTSGQSYHWMKDCACG